MIEGNFFIFPHYIVKNRQRNYLVLYVQLLYENFVFLPFYFLQMPIDNILSVQGRGTVIIGTIKKGRVKKGDNLQIIGFGADTKTTVSGLQVFKKQVDTAEAGDNVGINVRGVKSGSLKKGMLLVAPGSFNVTNHFDVSLRS